MQNHLFRYLQVSRKMCPKKRYYASFLPHGYGFLSASVILLCVQAEYHKELSMSIPASGTVALVGAGEYLPPIAPLDQAFLERVHGTPHVLVLHTAAARHGHIMHKTRISMEI